MANGQKSAQQTLLSALQEREVALCLRVWEEDRVLVCSLGRDAVRLLQNISHLPKMSTVWNALAQTTEDAEVPPMVSMLQEATPRELLQSRLSPSMEKEL